MTLGFQNCEFYDMLQEEKVLLSVTSNKIIDRVLEFIKKKAVVNCMNIIKDDELCHKIKDVFNHLVTRWKSNVVMRSHERFLTKNKSCSGFYFYCSKSRIQSSVNFHSVLV